MSPDYATVFQISRYSPDWPIGCIGLVPVAIGVGLTNLKRRFQWSEPKWAVPIFLCGFGTFWILVMGLSVLRQHQRFYEAYTTNDYFQVEGTVTDFDPMPYEGHRPECFSVQQRRFCYSDYELSPGFHQSTSHGGPIHEGLPVRIAYIGGTILRLDIPRANVVTPVQSAAVEKTNEQAYFESTGKDPSNQALNLGVSIAGFVLIVLANLRWRPAMRLWMKSKPPYKPFVEVLFRTLFAIALPGSIFQIWRSFPKSPITRTTVLHALTTAAIMLAVAAAMIGSTLWMVARRDAKIPPVRTPPAV